MAVGQLAFGKCSGFGSFGTLSMLQCMADLLPTELAGTPLSQALLRHPEWARVVDHWAMSTPIPIPSFRGFLAVSTHNLIGHTAYLLQQTPGTGGWWYYFPVAFAVKTPTGLPVLVLLGWATALRLAFQEGSRRAIIKVLLARQEWLTLRYPPLIYFLISTITHINIGLPHILPICPFLFVWTSLLLFSSRRPALPSFVRQEAVACLALVGSGRIRRGISPIYSRFSTGPAEAAVKAGSTWWILYYSRLGAGHETSAGVPET
jgi:hypothetical protein